MEITIIENINVIQFTSFIFGILILIEFYKLYKLDPKNWKRAINIVLYGLHLIIFYLLLYIDNINLIDFHLIVDPLFFTNWSSLLRLHGSITFYFLLRNTITFRKLTKKIEDIKVHYNKFGGR